MTQEEFKKYHEEILRGSAIHLITWIDYHAAPDKMCLSNEECKNIVDALVEGDWGKIYQYMKKKLEPSDNIGESASTLTQKEVQKLYDHLEMHKELSKSEPQTVTFIDSGTMQVIDKLNEIIGKLGDLYEVMSKPSIYPYEPIITTRPYYTPPSPVPGMDTHGVEKVPPVTCEINSEDENNEE